MSFLRRKDKKRKTPWRTAESQWDEQDAKSQWDEQYSRRLCAEIREFNINIGTRDRREMERVMANLLVLGPAKAGKSAFINSVLSISSGRRLRTADSADYEFGTVTTKYSIYGGDGEVDNIQLHDTPGLMEQEGQGFNSENFIPLIDGHIEDGYEFQRERGINESDPNYRPNSTRRDKINCVVFVVDVSTLKTLTDNYTQQIRALQNVLVDKGIPQVLLLTKCDKLSKHARKNTANIFRSKRIEKYVKYAGSKFGIQQSYIHPIVNYGENPDGLDEKVNIPILLALRQMVYFAGDYLENQVQVERSTPENTTG
ncbi:interferon-induced protein 44-like [Mercenaria mercenaria]|uniref:interferon-induced protein 44-like n=1 Tax=Mercenaria mercenaria TaxID=6596 RepID=UPI001E1E0A5E|nr:interferon-induced protein 44-like [Mercenaria mercenaria]